MNSSKNHTKILIILLGIIGAGIAMVLSVGSVSADTNAVAPDISSNQFLINETGDKPRTKFDSAIAWNEKKNEYLVVWVGNSYPDLALGELEIFGQILDADGNGLSAEFRISDMGPEGDPNYNAFNPAVSWNSTNNEYLVVWEGDNTSIGLGVDELNNDGFELVVDIQIFDSQNKKIDQELEGLVDEEFEIYGQIIDAQGNEIGTNDFRISTMGPDGDPDYAAKNPDVIWNSDQQEYYVVWEGSSDMFFHEIQLVADEFEIYGQRLNWQGGKIDTVTRISEMGYDGDSSYDAENPALTWNAANNEYLVVWSGDNITIGDGDFEIFGQRINAQGKIVTNTSNFLISDMGIDGDTTYNASLPAITWNAEENEYLVVWHGKEIIIMAPLPQFSQIPSTFRQLADSTENNPKQPYSSRITDDGHEIYGQLLDAQGIEIGDNDFPISDMDPVIDNDSYFPKNPAVAWDSTANEYLVVWKSGEDRDFRDAPLPTFGYEIFGQKIDALGHEIGDNDFRISSTGIDGVADTPPSEPEVVWNAADNNFFVVWKGGGLSHHYGIYGNFLTQTATLKFKQASYTATEGLNASANITVERLGLCDSKVSVDFAMEDGTADSGDYSPVGGTLTFAPGEREKIFYIELYDDFEDELDETVILGLSNAQAQTGLVEIGPFIYGQGIAELIIVDDDQDATVSLTSSIINGNDDVEEEQDGTMYTNSSDLEVIDDNNDNQTIGLVFRNLNIPQGATITNATLQFTTDEVSTGICDLVISGEATDNPADFTNNANDVSSRLTTGASVNWSPPGWNTIDEAGEDQKSPNIKTIIQEIVDRPGWIPDNSINILISGSGKRTAGAYESGADTAPKLVVEYTTNDGIDF